MLLVPNINPRINAHLIHGSFVDLWPHIRIGALLFRLCFWSATIRRESRPSSIMSWGDKSRQLGSLQPTTRLPSLPRDRPIVTRMDPVSLVTPIWAFKVCVNLVRSYLSNSYWLYHTWETRFTCQWLRHSVSYHTLVFFSQVLHYCTIRHSRFDRALTVTFSWVSYITINV